VYEKNRLEFYKDTVAHRHKYHGKEKNKNIPKYFVWLDKEGKEHHLSYVESRQFYCNFYERLAEQQEDFRVLQKKLEDGYVHYPSNFFLFFFFFFFFEVKSENLKVKIKKRKSIF
jgi:hypothetical protein